MRKTVVGSMLLDENDKFSSTRLCLFAGLAMALTAFVAETFFALGVAEVYHQVNKLLIGLMGGSSLVRGTAKTFAERGDPPE